MAFPPMFVCCFLLVPGLWVDRDPGCWSRLSCPELWGQAVVQVWVALWVLPPRVTSTDTATKERSGGNNTVTQVRTSSVLRLGCFLQISLGFGQLPRAAPAFRLPQVSPWLSDLLQAQGQTHQREALPFLGQGGCTDQQRVQLGD